MTKPDFRVGDYLVRPASGEIRSAEKTVRVEPRSMAVLVVLCERAPEICLKAELIREVWKDAFVSDDVVTHAIYDLRRAFGDKASDPRIIETIPKRGYRLIPPVRELKRGGEMSEAKRIVIPRRWRWTAGAIAVLATATAFFAWWPEPGAPQGPPALILEPTTGGTTESEVTRFYGLLRARLSGGQMRFFPDQRCRRKDDLWVFCLKLTSRPVQAGLEIQAEIIEQFTGQGFFSPAAAQVRDPSDVDLQVEELASELTTFMNAMDIPFARDPDVKAWFSVKDDDIRAIEQFLIGVGWVYDHVQGGRDGMDRAIELDPDFIAPLVWRTPTIVAEGDAVAEHEARLRKLLADRKGDSGDSQPTNFQRAMARWAIALIEGDLAAQINQLNAALGLTPEGEPENRPVKLMLAEALMALGDLEGAWKHLEPLSKTRWKHPLAYPAAARCALLMGNIGAARNSLNLATGDSPDDEESLALQLLFAVYDDRPEIQDHYRRRLDARVAQIAPEPFLFDFARFGEPLAEAAAAEGRPEVAKRLREFPD